MAIEKLRTIAWGLNSVTALQPRVLSNDCKIKSSNIIVRLLASHSDVGAGAQKRKISLLLYLGNESTQDLNSSQFPTLKLTDERIPVQTENFLCLWTQFMLVSQCLELRPLLISFPLSHVLECTTELEIIGKEGNTCYKHIRNNPESQSLLQTLEMRLLKIHWRRSIILLQHHCINACTHERMITVCPLRTRK